MTEALPQHRLQKGFRWPGRTLWDDVARHGVRRGDAPAVTDEHGTYNYRELVGATTRLAHHYREFEVGRGDVVLVQMRAARDFVPAFLAAERLGAIVCPVMPAMTGRAFGKIAGLALPRLVVTSNLPGDLEGVPDGVPVVTAGDGATESSLEALLDRRASQPLLLPEAPGPGALAELAFTSGTTDVPKGVLHTHATATAGIVSTIRRQGITADDVVHVALPVGHNFGYFYGVRLGLHAGSHVVLQSRWDPAGMLELGGRHGLTVSAGPPAFLSDLVTYRGVEDSRLETLRLFTCAGAKLEPDLAAEAVVALPGRISKAFGMTELGHVCSTTEAGPPDKILTTEGEPHPEIEMRVVGPEGRVLGNGREGEIAFRGPFLMVGYQDGADADAIDAEGFFKTGDLGYTDEDGFLVITGRVKNVVIRGGENIPAESVERALMSHPVVREAVVVGVPDERLGERPVVCLRSASGSPMTLAEVSGILEEFGIPRIHRPEAVVMMEAILRSETGKIRRAELRRIAAERATFGEEVEDDD